jgi:hypothetical protein
MLGLCLSLHFGAVIPETPPFLMDRTEMSWTKNVIEFVHQNMPFFSGTGCWSTCAEANLAMPLPLPMLSSNKLLSGRATQLSLDHHIWM